MLQIHFPAIDPVFLNLGPVQLRWYGLMYMASFIIGYFLLKRAVKRRDMGLTTDDLYDLLFLLILGVMLGGRLGYVLFYGIHDYINTPFEIFKIWKGGMSFHGGFLGVILAGIYFARKKKRSFWELADLVAAIAPIGLGLGRIGNFINGELYGRPTSLPWGVVFPEGGPMPRHPSQLYEALAEGLLLFIVLGWLYRRKYRDGVVFWGLVGFYGIARFLAEFVRQPDGQIGFDIGETFTRGQLLTFPMVVIGLVMMIKGIRKGRDVPAAARARKAKG